MYVNIIHASEKENKNILIAKSVIVKDFFENVKKVYIKYFTYIL